MTMGGKLSKREPDEIPGPGNYEQKQKVGAEGP